jgi:hypothetical protein
MAGTVLIEQMHSAARVPPDTTAFSRREKSFNVGALAIWGTPPVTPTTSPGRGARPPLGNARPAAAATSTTDPDEPIEGVRAAYGDANFERLRQVKRRYNPHNLFHFNHNIPPRRGQGGSPDGAGEQDCRGTPAVGRRQRVGCGHDGSP